MGILEAIDKYATIIIGVAIALPILVMGVRKLLEAIPGDQGEEKLVKAEGFLAKVSELLSRFKKPKA
mgnify:CR=1 FL=1